MQRHVGSLRFENKKKKCESGNESGVVVIDQEGPTEHKEGARRACVLVEAIAQRCRSAKQKEAVNNIPYWQFLARTSHEHSTLVPLESSARA
jgi:hypothetical protein